MLRIINRENILLLPMENQRAFYSSPAQLVQVKRKLQKHWLKKYMVMKAHASDCQLMCDAAFINC